MTNQTIFITVSDTTVTRNIIDTPLTANLIERGVNVVLVCPEQRVAHYQERYAARGVAVVSFPQTPQSIVERALSFAARNAFRSRTLRLMQWRAFLSHESSVHPYIKYAFAYLFGHRLFRMVVRLCDRAQSSPPGLLELFDKYRPALVLSTMLLDATIDVPMVREAKRQGVPVTGMVRSWDNLTTYGFIRVLPDRFIAQNNFIRDMAIHRHDVSAKRIEVIGLPHYDAYVAPSGIVSRVEFCATLGLDPYKPIWLYAAVGDFLFPAEATLTPILNELAEKFDAQVLFRAHPAHASETASFTHLKHITFDRTVAYLSDGFNAWEMRAEHESHFINTLHHSDILITASGTSMLVDGAVFDKPLISVAFDGEKTMPYWFSIRRFFDHADHSKALLDQGGTRIVNTKDELEEALAAYIHDPHLLADGRRRIIDLLAAPVGGASERLAEALMRCVRR
ncbi:MAG: hypothetical protein AAB582_02745 [Patescibacteria group bacterium]